MHRLEPTNVGTSSLLRYGLIWEGLTMAVTVLCGLGFGFGNLNWPTLSLLGCFHAVGIAVLLSGLSSWMGRRVIPDLEFRIETKTAQLGDDIPFEVTFTPTSTVALECVEVVLSCEERAERDEGTSAKVFSKTIYHDEARLGEDELLRTDREARFTGTFHTPADGVSSYESEHARIRWMLGVTIRISGWFDIQETYDLTVRPIVGELAPPPPETPVEEPDDPLASPVVEQALEEL